MVLGLLRNGQYYQVSNTGGLRFMKKRGRRVSSFLMAILLVIGMMPMDWTQQVVRAATSFTGGEKVSDENSAWNGWTWSVFGNSATVEKNTIKENKDSSVTLASTGGKIAGSNDGIDYLYYELTADKDFTITAKARVDAIKVDKQVGFGLMVRAAVGEHGNTAEASPLNSTFVGASMKSATEVYNGNRKAPKNGYVGSAGIVDIAQGNTYDLCIQKVGSDIILSMQGVVIGTVAASDIIKGNTMYVGMFAARNCTITYSDVTLSYADTNQTVSVGSVTQPSKTQYIMGNTYDDIDLTGFSADVTIGSEKRTISAADCRVDSFDFDSVTDNGKIVLDYYGAKIDIPVTVVKEVVTSIDVEYNPVKLEYELGSKDVDWTGFEATVSYNSGVTKSLLELINSGDEETTVDYDFSKAGSTNIKVTHTHGDISKSIEIPVVVSDASVVGLEIKNQPNETVFYVGQEIEEGSGKDGLMININYSDGSNRIISSGFTVTADETTGALDTSKAGTYKYNVGYSGKTVSYELTVKEDEIDKLDITQYPSKTTYVKGEEFTSDGIKVTRILKSGAELDITDEVKIDSSAFDKDNAGDYKINISYVWSDNKTYTTEYTVSVRDKITYNYDDIAKKYGWNSIVFGQSTADGKQAEVKDGIITVESKEGVGKCTDDGQDGITYYYTAINPQTDNFEMTAKVKVDYFITKTKPDNQEGFGLMVRDSIGTNMDSSIYLSNAMSVGGYYGRYNVFGRYNITSQSDGGNRINVNKYGSKMTSLDYQVKEDAPKTFELTLKKDNTGVYATMKDEEGNVVEHIDGSLAAYLPSNTFSAQEPDKMYIGFMTARGAKIEVDTSTIALTVTSAAADEPQKFAPEKPVNPSVSMNSITETGDEDYTVTVKVNTPGLLTVKQQGKAITSQEYVTAGTYNYATKLTAGDNKIQLYFEPDATFNISSAAPVSANYTVVRNVYQPDSYIYVSPDGTADGDGSKEHPLDLQTAITYCESGQGIYMEGGTYKYSKSAGIWKGNNGTSEAPKVLSADPDNTEDVIIDFSKDDGTASGNTFDISGNYWIIKGLKIVNGGGVRVGGNHNIVMNCDFAGHTNSGLSISRTDGSNNKEDWPSYNEIISCNAYANRDPSDNNADGFAAKLTCGVGNVFKYCVAAFNADDGWDLFSKTATGPIGEVKIYDSICYGNGFYIDADGEVKATAGDGNGFKMGGSGLAVMHEAYNCISFGNKTNGFTNNSDPMGKYIDCMGYNNGGSNLELHVYTGAEPQFTVTNFKSFADSTYQNISTDIAEGDLTETEAEEACISTVRAKGNYFYNAETGKSEDAEGNELTEYDFVSLSELVDYVKGGIGSVKRNEDGTLNLGNFLKVRELSALKAGIEKAESVINNATEAAKYTTDSIKALSDATADAKKVLTTHDGQSVIDAKAEAIEAAIAALVNRGDATALNAKVKEAENILSGDTSKYTKESVEALRKAVGEVKAELTQDKLANATQEALDSLTSKLTKAINDLKVIVVTPTVDVDGDDSDSVNISDSNEDLLKKILTEDELEAVKNGSVVKITVDITKRADGLTEVEKKAFENVLKNNQVLGKAFDINIVKNIDGSETNVTTTNKSITFSIKLDKELINTDTNVNREYSIVRIHDGKAEFIPCEFDSATGTITFSSDKFSVFAVVYSDTKTDNGNNNNNGNTNNGGNNNNNGNTNNGGNNNNNGNINNGGNNNNNGNTNNGGNNNNSGNINNGANNVNDANVNNNNNQAGGNVDVNNNQNTDKVQSADKTVQAGDVKGMYIPVFGMLLLISAGAIVVVSKKKRAHK